MCVQMFEVPASQRPVALELALTEPLAGRIVMRKGFVTPAVGHNVHRKFVQERRLEIKELALRTTRIDDAANGDR